MAAIITSKFRFHNAEQFKESFQAFAQNARVTLHVENLNAEINHHIIES